jgi:hypothetical protein
MPTNPFCECGKSALWHERAVEKRMIAFGKDAGSAVFFVSILSPMLAKLAACPGERATLYLLLLLARERIALDPPCMNE